MSGRRQFRKRDWQPDTDDRYSTVIAVVTALVPVIVFVVFAVVLVVLVTVFFVVVVVVLLFTVVVSFLSALLLYSLRALLLLSVREEKYPSLGLNHFKWDGICINIQPNRSGGRRASCDSNHAGKSIRIGAN